MIREREPADEATPYLSVVVTSRNDDHGRALLPRMQCFLDALAAQAQRHRVRCELVLVEWNPPPDRASLVDALNWPGDEGWCPVRIVTVPASIHRTFLYSDRLPMFQMIAKNVGIRRSRGSFVLASNVDVIYSDALMGFLAERTLLPGHLYRSDRIDVSDRVVAERGIEARLAFCGTHVLRAYRPEGVFSAPADGRPHGVGEARFAPMDANDGAPVRAVRRLGRALRRVEARHVDPRWGWQVLRAVRRAGSHVGSVRRRLTGALGAGGRPGSATGPSLQEIIDDVMVPLRRVPALHLLACGDFTLMARGTWERMGGNPELEMFSLNLDSLAMYVAHGHGVREVRLGRELVHYHIEHAGGWTPEGSRGMYEAIQNRAVPIMTVGTLARLGEAVIRDPSLRFSGPDWGLARVALPETWVRCGTIVRTDGACAIGDTRGSFQGS